MHQVFISYSTRNKPVADAICMHLETRGISCWYAPRDILPGKDWVEAIMDAIESAKVFLLIYSSDSNQSRQVQNEVAAAFNAGCAIVPFRLDDTKMVSKMAYFLNSVHWLDAAHSPPSTTFQELSNYIPTLLHASDPEIPTHRDSQQVQAPQAKEPPAPLQGLRSLLAGASDLDADVWVELKLSADPAQADQQVRGNVMLPHGNGRTPRVLVLTKIPSKVQEARLAGADYAGGEELCEKIAGQNWLDFDAVVASPEIMGIIGRMSPVLSPRGLMPSPKAGTLTPAVGDAVRKLKSGQLSYRMDNHGSIRCIIGKVSFGTEKLADNMDTLIRAVVKAKPAAVNGQFIRSCTVSSNTGPGIEVSTTKYL